jgi:uroporphyrinogen III methyltransferase/synthase
VKALVSLVGAGPGDPSLITLAGVRALARADVVLYDALVHRAVLDHARPTALRTFVGKRAGHDGIRQEEIHGLILEHARAGRRVCRLKGGDPLLFGRGSEEAEFLRAHEISFEVIPGVSSVLGATAYAGIPLTHRAHASSVAFVTSSEHAQRSESAHDWSLLANGTQTLVLFMGVRRVRQEMARLIEHGRPPHTPAAAIEWGTFARQRVVTGTVADLADRCEHEDLKPPALLVVGAVAALREELRWWDAQPLFGVQVALTQSIERQSSLTESLLEEGAEPLRLPAIESVSATDPEPLARAARQADEYDLLAFSSPPAVDRFFEALRAQQRDARALGRARVAAIGDATAAALRAHGIIADISARTSTEPSLEHALRAPQGGAKGGWRALIPRAAKGGELLESRLRALGWSVDVVAAYETLPHAPGLSDLRGALEDGAVDVIVFSSAVAVDAVCDGLGERAGQLLAPVTIASLGPKTSEQARARGLAVTCQALEPTDEGLLASLRAHFAARRASR